MQYILLLNTFIFHIIICSAPELLLVGPQSGKCSFSMLYYVCISKERPGIELVRKNSRQLQLGSKS